MITQVDYDALIIALLVPDKRTTNTVAWNEALVDSTANEHSIIFDYYKQGLIAPFWSATTYNIGDIVRYGKSTWQNTLSGNTVAPSTNNSWALVAENFIGVDDRILFTGEKLTLEYALNKWFDTTFRQPNLVSDIYITTNTNTESTFIIGNFDDESSLMGNETSSEYVTNSYVNVAAFNNMIIWVPITKLSTLGTTLADQKNTVRMFGDKYVAAGIIYDVQSY